MVESQPSKLLVAGPIPVSRSKFFISLPSKTLYDGTTAPHFRSAISSRHIARLGFGANSALFVWLDASLKAGGSLALARRPFPFGGFVSIAARDIRDQSFLLFQRAIAALKPPEIGNSLNGPREHYCRLY
jgi:hypothetical protein